MYYNIECVKFVYFILFVLLGQAKQLLRFVLQGKKVQYTIIPAVRTHKNWNFWNPSLYLRKHSLASYTIIFCGIDILILNV